MCIALRRAPPPVVSYPGWLATRDLIRRHYLCPPRSRLRLPRGNAAGMSDSGPDDRGAIGALTDRIPSGLTTRRRGERSDAALVARGMPRSAPADREPPHYAQTSTNWEGSDVDRGERHVSSGLCRDCASPASHPRRRRVSRSGSGARVFPYHPQRTQLAGGRDARGAPTGSLCLRSSAALLCRQAATTPRARSLVANHDLTRAQANSAFRRSLPLRELSPKSR